MKKLASVLLFGIFLVAPLFTLANGLVPCGGIGEQPCQSCDVVNLVNNVIQWLVVVLGTIAALVIIYAGVKLVISGGNQAAMEESKSMITNIIIGYIIVLSGWLLIDFGMKALIDEGAFGVWNAVQCVAQPVAEKKDQVTLDYETGLSNPYASLSGSGGWSGTTDKGVARATCDLVPGPGPGSPLRYNCDKQKASCTNAGGNPVVSSAGDAVDCKPVNYRSGSGSGSCTVVTDPNNACYPNKLTCFPDKNLASKICNLESRGGNTGIMSGTDLCMDGKSFSGGLWQINILANSRLLPGCTGGFFTSDNGGRSEGSCAQYITNSRGVRYCQFRSCRITNVSMYNHCVIQARTPSVNTAAACSLMRTQGWSAWQTSYNACR